MESAGHILAESPRLKQLLKSARPLTPSQQKLLNAATVIRLDPDQVEKAYIGPATGAMHFAAQQPRQHTGMDAPER
jgi:hypothetical protein